MLRVGKFGGWDFVGGCPKCPKLGIGHFGHIRFKIFLIFDFDGHLVDMNNFVGSGCLQSPLDKCWTGDLSTCILVVIFSESRHH